MGLNRKSAAKLASLSALGAGALTLTPEKAQAGIIYSGAIDLQIGCGCGPFSAFGSASLSGPNQLVNLSFLAVGTSTQVASNLFRSYRAIKGRGSAQISGPTSNVLLQFQLTPPNPLGTGLGAGLAPPRFMKLFAANAVWPGSVSVGAGSGWPYSSGPSSSGNGFAIAHRMLSSTYSFAPAGAGGLSFPNPLNPNEHYLLFSFSDSTCGAGDRCYGWVDLDIALDPDNGPQMTVRSWAYDDSGALLPAGYAPVPEPSTSALTGLAALALGARGIRRWRASRPGADA